VAALGVLQDEIFLVILPQLSLGKPLRLGDGMRSWFSGPDLMECPLD
jgi:hypothetical protein